MWTVCMLSAYVLCPSVLFIWLQFAPNLSGTEHSRFVSTINIKSFINWPVKMCFHFIVYCTALALELKYLSPLDLLLLSGRKQAVYRPPVPCYISFCIICLQKVRVFILCVTKLMPTCIQTYGCAFVSDSIFDLVLTIFSYHMRQEFLLH